MELQQFQAPERSLALKRQPLVLRGLRLTPVPNRETGAFAALIHCALYGNLSLRFIAIQHFT